jgi:hypothetical protein
MKCTKGEIFMRKMVLFLIPIILLGVNQAFSYQSLQEVFDNAGPGEGYDKYVVLNPFVEYEGDLIIESAGSVRIIGNGAMIFGNQFHRCIQVFDSQLDISGCIIKIIGPGGYRVCIAYSTDSYGSVFNNTLISSNYAGVFTDGEHSINPGVEIYDNIMFDCRFSILGYDVLVPVYIAYNIIFESRAYDYAKICPG